MANLVATDLIAASVMEAAFRAESGFSRRPSNPLAAWPCSLAQIAACVRFPAPIFRRIDFMWTLTVASLTSHVRPITLLACPFTRPSRIWTSRSDRLG
jgi:hypothetical protein